SDKCRRNWSRIDRRGLGWRDCGPRYRGERFQREESLAVQLRLRKALRKQDSGARGIQNVPPDTEQSRDQLWNAPLPVRKGGYRDLPRRDAPSLTLREDRETIPGTRILQGLPWIGLHYEADGDTQQSLPELSQGPVTIRNMEAPSRFDPGRNQDAIQLREKSQSQYIAQFAPVEVKHLSSPDITPFESRRVDDQALVMEMLSTETDATYTFQGLKRRLGLHQEKLTRILRRLEDNNLVAKTEEGYRTLKHSRKATQHLVNGEPVIRGQLPPGIDSQSLLGKIKGRWFKNFRWVGYANGTDELSLYWITEDNKFQVRIQLSPIEILVWSQPTDPKETDSPVTAAYELFDR